MIAMKPVNRMLSAESIAKIEEKYSAKYVIDGCLKHSDDWINFPVAVFYREEKHPRGSNYFALYLSSDGAVITDGLSAVQGEFQGFLFDDGTLVHSRYRHDYFTYGNAMVDGGRDYFRSSECPPGARFVTFSVADGLLVEASRS